MKKILITGVNGFLGTYLAKTYDKKDILLQGTFYESVESDDDRSILKRFLDVSDAEKVNEILSDFNPDCIIHTAGMSNVDMAEQNPQLCFDTNVKGTWNIATWCKAHQKQLVYCSTNAIFSGNEAPYDENSLPYPVNVYGTHKYIAESIAATLPSHLIFRIILTYGWNYKSRANPVTFVIKSLREGKKISMVHKSSYINPLYIESCCDTIWKAITLGKECEKYHLAGKDVCDRYELALQVAEVFKLDASLITPVPDSFFSSLAKRPFNTSYVTHKAEKELGFIPLSLREGLQRMKEVESSAKTIPLESTNYK